MTMIPLEIWAVYDHPSDFPHHYVARKWLNDKPTTETIGAVDIDVLRLKLERRGLTKLNRHPSDDPMIMETWL